MRKSRKKGVFIVFEGIDKCGKSTQIKLLAKRWRRLGRSCFLTREPGGTTLGEKIRKLLLDKNEDICPKAELLLYEASRAQHVASKILPALKRGRVVLSDRFSLATLAYQAMGRGLSLDEAKRLNVSASLGIQPDLTIVLDIPIAESIRRMKGRRDRMEAKESFLRKVRLAYLALAKTIPDIFVIDGRQSQQVLHGQIAKLIENHPKFKEVRSTKYEVRSSKSRVRHSPFALRTSHFG